MGRKRRRGMTRHHIRPCSRGGEDDDSNLVVLDRDFHFAWHECFRNLTNDDIMAFIKIIMVPGLVWSHESLELLKQGFAEGNVNKIAKAIGEAQDG